MTITFVNPDGEDFLIETVVPPAGQSETVLWPGASVDPPDWPGWELDENGIWVETTEDAGAFTRAPGGVEVQFTTNPTLTTQVTYPPASAICANPQNPGGEVPPPGGEVPPPGSVPPGGGLPESGLGLGLLPLGGLAALGAGAGLVAASRRRDRA
jgi:hypothetical protein